MSDASRAKMQAVLNFINEYNAEYGYAPTVREICAELNIKSTASAYYYIEKLTDEGYLSKSPNKNRAVSFKKNASVNIPLIGTVTAGQPIFAYENYEDYYSFPAGSFKGSDLFMLSVQGESMIEAGIYDGDKIIVRKQSVAENGDIVVALIDAPRRREGDRRRSRLPQGTECSRHPAASGRKAISPELTKRFRARRDHAPATLSNQKTDSRNLAA